MNVKQLLSLENKIALVTGGAGLYGSCIAEGLAEADATVIIASRNLDAIEEKAAELQSKSLKVYGMQLDQSDPDSVKQIKSEILNKFGRLDIFVNNAVTRPMSGYNAPIEQFGESMKVNATGMMDLLREMADLIISGGGGSIINIASMFGMYGPDLTNYEGTNMGDLPPDYFFHNAGVINITRFLSKMLGGKNIRINCISPGGIFSGQPGRFVDNYCAKVPLRRMANNDDIKGLAVLLASDAGGYINGENILIDGGLNA